MDEFIKIVKNDNIKKFIISGDLVDKDSKKYINSLKSKGVEDRNSWSSYMISLKYIKLFEAFDSSKVSGVISYIKTSL
jgi:hypothetical protein